MVMWDTHGEKWDVMSQFSPYIPLRIVPVLPMPTRFIPHSHIHEEGRKDTPSTVNVRYCIYSTCFTHLQKEKKTNCYTENLCFVTVLAKLSAIWFWSEMWWRQLRATEKRFLEADWLKIADVISGVPALPCPSSPRPPLVVGQRK